MTDTVQLWKQTPGMCEEIPVLDIYIPENKTTDIAVVISGDGYDYPLWKMFHDSYPEATLRHVLVDDTNMVLKEAESEKEPDCILWIERGRLEVGQTLDYNGVTYVCVFVAESEKAPDSLLIKQTE